MILELYLYLLTPSFFTTSLTLFKSARTVTNLPTFNLSALLFQLFKPVATFPNLSRSYLSTSDIKLAKSSSLANIDVSGTVTLFKS